VVPRAVAAIRVPLTHAYQHAPQGWREALAPLSGPLRVTHDVIRLSERPLAPLTSANWDRAGAPLAPFHPGSPLQPAAQGSNSSTLRGSQATVFAFCVI